METIKKIAQNTDEKTKFPGITRETNPKEETNHTQNLILKGREVTPEEFDSMVDDYFNVGGTEREVIVGSGSNKQIRTIKVFTLTGMCLFLGFVDKLSLFKLERNNLYGQAIKRARSRIEQIYEENLQTTGNSANIFALKNFGWVDKQEIIHEEKHLKLDV